MKQVWRIAGLTLAAWLTLAQADRTSAQNQAPTIIVIPVKATEVVELAARELRDAVRAATGAAMPIVAEDDCPATATRAQCIYLGPTAAAREAGIGPARLPRNAYHIRRTGDVTILAGSDGAGDPLDSGLRTPVGTLFAVYDVLDRDLGVRWLWPGASGEFVPRRDALRIAERDTTVLPRFRFAGLRTDRPDEIHWMRRMRMHNDDYMNYGHAFDWGERYFAEHPDWFEMDEAGVRHPDRSMCVSNPGFQRQIVENWWAQRQRYPDMKRIVNICENDGLGGCCCPNCLAWDGPGPGWPRPTPYDNVHHVSRRYARFGMEVLKLAREHDPEAEVVGYAYSNMIFDPSAPEGAGGDDLRLDRGVIMGYVPDVFFPRTPEAHDWVHRQWLGWTEAGASLFLRPNYLLHGYCMPVNWTRQMAEDFKFFESHGMIGTDFDSLTGMWSTMGLPLYVLGRLHVDPSFTADQLIDEYCAAFGPGSGQVKAYWDYWERYSFDHLDTFQDGLWHYARYPERVADRFPLASFEPAVGLLAAAEAAAAADPAAAARVAFLRTGLRHARLCVKTSIAFAEAGTDEAKRKTAVAELVEFRKTIGDPMVVNLSDSGCPAMERNLEWPL